MSGPTDATAAPDGRMARMGVDFAKSAGDYARHRAGFPESFYRRLAAYGVGFPGEHLIDLGTGTGTIARRFARAGLNVTGLDPSPGMLAAAECLAADEALTINWVEGRAEATGLSDQSAEIVTAGQCWHWFDCEAAAREVFRLLKPGGTAVVCHYDWLPLPGSMVAETEALILKHNPDWAPLSGSTGIHPRTTLDLAGAGFVEIETFSYDEPAIYSHQGWVGRLHACAGVGAALPAEKVAIFDQELLAMLAARNEEDPMEVPHRVFVILAHRPLA